MHQPSSPTRIGLMPRMRGCSTCDEGSLLAWVCVICCTHAPSTLLATRAARCFACWFPRAGTLTLNWQSEDIDNDDDEDDDGDYKNDDDDEEDEDDDGDEDDHSYEDDNDEDGEYENGEDDDHDDDHEGEDDVRHTKWWHVTVLIVCFECVLSKFSSFGR